jgi:hypothetical protein
LALLQEGFCLPAASGSFGGRHCTAQTTPGSLRNLASFQTCGRGFSSLADSCFASPREPLAFPFHNMGRAASGQNLLRCIGFRGDGAQR